MSAIDPTLPATGTAHTAEVRANFAAAASEIDAATAAAAAADAKAQTALDNAPASLIAGSAINVTPLPYNDLLTQAHGLPEIPTFATLSLICITPEYGYATGDKIILNIDPQNSAPAAWSTTSVDATNIYLTVASGWPTFNDRRAGFYAYRRTPSGDNWRLVLTPYLLA